MKLWVDAITPAPKGYEWCKSVDEAKKVIVDTDEMNEIPRMYNMNFTIELVDIDSNKSVELREWFEETDHNYPIHTHSTTSVIYGKWIVDEYSNHLEAECSVCKKSYYVYKQGQYRIEQSNFCPNCGARMDGGK